jgi:hypothetical protein
VAQFLLALDYLEHTGTLDNEAVDALAAIVTTARTDARAVADALPVPLRCVAAWQDVKGGKAKHTQAATH